MPSPNLKSKVTGDGIEFGNDFSKLNFVCSKASSKSRGYNFGMQLVSEKYLRFPQILNFPMMLEFDKILSKTQFHHQILNLKLLVMALGLEMIFQN